MNKIAKTFAALDYRFLRLLVKVRRFADSDAGERLESFPVAAAAICGALVLLAAALR